MVLAGSKAGGQTPGHPTAQDADATQHPQWAECPPTPAPINHLLSTRKTALGKGESGPFLAHLPRNRSQPPHRTQGPPRAEGKLLPRALLSTATPSLPGVPGALPPPPLLCPPSCPEDKVSAEGIRRRPSSTPLPPPHFSCYFPLGVLSPHLLKWLPLRRWQAVRNTIWSKADIK